MDVYCLQRGHEVGSLFRCRGAGRLSRKMLFSGPAARLANGVPVSADAMGKGFSTEAGCGRISKTCSVVVLNQDAVSGYRPAGLCGCVAAGSKRNQYRL